jgi:hypothetical protein
VACSATYPPGELYGINPADYIYTAAILAIQRREALLPWEFAALPDAA